ncbi:copper-binding protein [Rhodobacteraceae bacterium B1Z28]|uniref:Copper-binding protein n=1 Tax=Ruegeria haliotis TaxID=2747601 RepID=A0ABX2PZF8_9RHOB|nr:copper-binding protein [Ruegeria haliotis]NVO58399.1 copper-binding protein [Ruegeria haliotis]
MQQAISRRSVLIGVTASAATAFLGSQARAGETHEILIKRFKFEPQTVRARVGDIVRWTNLDIAPHTATADAFGWDTGELLRDESAEIAVADGMELTYFCAFHPHMKATIEIV